MTESSKRLLNSLGETIRRFNVIKKALPCLGLLGLLVLSLSGQKANPTNPAEPSYALLDLYVKTFQDMAASAAGGRDLVEKKLREIMAQANSARADNKTDSVFHARFSKLMTVTLLGILPDPERIYSPLVDSEISRFIKETIGEDVPTNQKAPIGQLARALAMSVIDLRIYLDNRNERNKMWEELAKGPSDKQKVGKLQYPF